MRLTPEQLDTLQGLVSLGIGRAAGMLNELIGTRVRLQVPAIREVSTPELQQAMTQLSKDWLAAVRLSFTGSFAGATALVFPVGVATKLVAALVGDDQDPTELDSLREGTLCEVGNIVISGIMGTVSNMLQQHLSYSPPVYIERTPEHILTFDGFQASNMALVAQTRFTVKQRQIEGDFVLLFEVGSVDALLSALTPSSQVAEHEGA